MAVAGALSLSRGALALALLPGPTAPVLGSSTVPLETVTPRPFWTELGRQAELRLREVGCQVSWARLLGTVADPGAEVCYRQGFTSVCVRAKMNVVGDMSYAVSLSNGPHPCDAYR